MWRYGELTHRSVRDGRGLVCDIILDPRVMTRPCYTSQLSSSTNGHIRPGPGIIINCGNTTQQALADGDHTSDVEGKNHTLGILTVFFIVTSHTQTQFRKSFYR